MTSDSSARPATPTSTTLGFLTFDRYSNQKHLDHRNLLNRTSADYQAGNAVTTLESNNCPHHYRNHGSNQYPDELSCGGLCLVPFSKPCPLFPGIPPALSRPGQVQRQLRPPLGIAHTQDKDTHMRSVSPRLDRARGHFVTVVRDGVRSGTQNHPLAQR